MSHPHSQQKLIAAHIESLSHDGRGISHINGKTTFIEGALPGEDIQFVYSKKHRNFDEARVIEVIKPSPDRLEPQCQHFSICGGCSLQHMQPAMQIQIKQAALLDQLLRFASIKPQVVLPPLLGPIWGYRRKARLSVKYVVKKESVLVGFHEKNSHFVADLVQCETLHPAIGQLITPLKLLISNLKAYQFIPQIEVAIGEQDMVLIIRHLQELTEEDLAALCAFATKHELIIYLQPGGMDSIHLLWPKTFKGLLAYKLPNLQLELLFKATDFCQNNFDINQQMIELALELLAINADDQILDLFCGIGNFTLPLAQRCKKVTGVDGNGSAIERAHCNAQHNKITNTEFFSSDLTQNLMQTPWGKQQFTKILLDPPRTGAESTLAAVANFKAQRMVYISCNPATFARDAGVLVNDYGYQLHTLGVMDMFPHTSHVESIALFVKS